MNNKEKYNTAVKALGLKNIIIKVITLVLWILKPQNAIQKCQEIYNKVKSGKMSPEHGIAAIGFINEFFSRYITYGKSEAEIININKLIDSKVMSGNMRQDIIIELRKIRKRIKKFDVKITDDQSFIQKNNFGVSKGVVSGYVLHIKSGFEYVSKNNICIFPTSGTKFTNLYSKCGGIIFKNGAMTSHGAIIAREYNIPAIVASNSNLNNGEFIKIDGLLGQIYKL